MPPPPPPPPPPTRRPWQEQLHLVDALMKAVSQETDPQSLVRTYARGVRELFHVDQVVSISRRGVDAPWYRITRSRRWEKEVNPWEQKDQLPLHSGGILGEWLYAGKAQFVEKFEVEDHDPAYFHLSGLSAAFVMPQYDQGEAVNMTIMAWKDASAVDVNQIPNAHWQGNLFGRTTHTLVLRKELAKAYESLDRELQVVGAMQRSLLPQELPKIPGVQLAADYRTSARAGGDLYDLFPMDDGSWGIFIADVSGHGTPAAVIMAITHAISHAPPPPGPPLYPRDVLSYVNARLSRDYTSRTPSFVTAKYATYAPKTRTLTYSVAGHPPARLVRNGRVIPLDGPRGLPLGILDDEIYQDASVTLEPGDLVFMFTDGISESFSPFPQNQMFGFDRLDAVLAGLPRSASADDAIAAVQQAVDAWQGDRARVDDQTMLALKVE